MTNYTASEIEKLNALSALMDYYGKDHPMKISEEQALVFLEKLKNGEITISNDKTL